MKAGRDRTKELHGDNSSGDEVGMVRSKLWGWETVTAGTVGDGDKSCPHAAL